MNRFPTIKEWWPMPENMRAPTGDVATLRRFLLKYVCGLGGLSWCCPLHPHISIHDSMYPTPKNREAKVDTDLQLALSRGHEVLLKCELPASGGGGGATYGFLAVPIAYEREVGLSFFVVAGVLCRVVSILCVLGLSLLFCPWVV